MEMMNDLKALLRHDVQMLCSVEDQIIEALPVMVAKAQSLALKQALEQHLKVTIKQRDRLDVVRQLLGANEDSVKNYTGVLSNLTGKATKCVGMEGLIDEGQKIMAENLIPEVMDAAIIGSCQKIEHFEVACYGTAKAYAQQLGLEQATNLLQQTLMEEIEADKLLSALAITSINRKAEAAF